MKYLTKLALLAALVVPLSGCYTFTHQVGTGASGGTETEARQWFILWGLVELNDVDSKQMAGNATNYTVTTEFTFLDVVISFFTSLGTVYVQTVSVER